MANRVVSNRKGKQCVDPDEMASSRSVEFKAFNFDNNQERTLKWYWVKNSKNIGKRGTGPPCTTDGRWMVRWRD